MKVVNLDWLEIYCHEGSNFPCDGDYFRRQGYNVSAREFGTPQYREMFTILDARRFPMYEIRRNPYSIKRNGGVFDENACHIRLANRQCYSPTAVRDLREFLLRHDYTYNNISRVDIAADFNRFDNGDSPADFVRRYMAGSYHKIGNSRVHVYGQDYNASELVVIDNRGKVIQRPKILHRGTEVAAHGTDDNYCKSFTSLKWGSPSSRVNTKLYLKSKELAEVGMKFYILDNWEAVGLDTSDVWRLEFSVSSDAKNWACDDTGEFFRLGFEQIDTPDRLSFLWNILAAKYFVFTTATTTRTGTPQRKDRCPRYNPFDLSAVDSFRPVTLTTDKPLNRTERMLLRWLYDIRHDPATPTDAKWGCKQVIEYLNKHSRTFCERKFKKI